ncbi:cyclin-dependent kinase 12 isoform X1 [Pangasianodon hypophthalmus]|uniref:cyclin-dependent kinase 12 isoform X1 n=1 Tax=Pangasianodon hypophthalmus TaxID=310915 RepID=UPI0023081D04|nr:cyclin-dependent kinase 12 isoform X1 [Pangasianodon hypophthalmus]
MADKSEACDPWPTVILPYGLKTLLECLSRALLIERAENIRRFFADYTAELLVYRNQNPSLDLKEVMIRFQTRREAILKRSSKKRKCMKSEEASDIGKESEKSSPNLFSTSQEDALLSNEESSNGVDRTHSSEVSLTPPEYVPDVKLLQETLLGEDKYLANEQTSKRGFTARCSSSETQSEVQSDQAPSPKSSSEEIETETRTTLPSKRLSPSSSPSPSYPRSPSSVEFLSDDYRKAKALYMEKEMRQLSQHSSRMSSKAPEKILPPLNKISAMSSAPGKPCRLLPKRQTAAKESFLGRAENVTVTKSGKSKEDAKLPPIPSSHRGRPDSHDLRKPGPLRSTEKITFLPQIGTKSQRPGPIQAIRVSSTPSEEEEDTENEIWTLYHLPHRREEGILSTTVLSQPQYRNGATIQTIRPGYVVVAACPTARSPDQKFIHGRRYRVSTLGSGQRLTGVDHDYMVIRPPPYQCNNI